jgi:hypothetical protein
MDKNYKSDYQQPFHLFFFTKKEHISDIYVGAFFLSSARMCGLYLIVIQICLYLYTEYGTSY